MNPLDIFYHEGKIDRTLVEEFAQEKGVILPDSYIDLISQYNFLRLNNRIFRFKNYLEKRFEYDERDISFDGYNEDRENYPISSFISSLIYESMTNDETDTTNYGNSVIEFGSCANGDAVCFDYREKNHDPKIVLMLHDEYIKDENGNEKMTLIPIADSFDAFMDMLYDPRKED
ncbi:MAG: SMI1/KNR4 family protein [Cardiobacteriaceae bacterium]|nr:SMI1/KNR4 family protein [Cardiobacteriaceae bacterium]